MLRLGGPPDRSVVTLALYHADLEPDELTRRIGVAPSESHRRGELRGKRKIPYRTGSWMLTVERTAPDSVQECCDELLARIPTEEALWSSLATEYDIQLRVSVFFDAVNRGFDLTPTLLSRLTLFHASLVVDIYAS